MTSPGLPRTALVLGGGSDIAMATVRALAGRSLAKAMLAVRSPERLEEQLAAAPLPASLEYTVDAWDASELESHEYLLARAASVLGTVDLVLCAVGSLGHGSGLASSPGEARSLIDANFTGPATAVLAAAHFLQKQGSGTIVVLSSVAGLRARKSNFLYGSAKAGLDSFTSGLADALHGTGVRVVLVRPGFVHSKMTTGLAPAPFAAAPDDVAAAILAAVAAGRSRTVHVPRLLGPLFAGLRATPRPLWRRIAANR